MKTAANSPASPASLTPIPARERTTFVSLGAAFTAFVGMIGLIGWIFDVSVLKSGWPGQIEMKANSGICLISLGISLWLRKKESEQTRGRILAAQLLAGFAAGVGLASFGEYLFGWDLGIDQLLFADDPAEGARSVRLGLMPPVNGLNLALLGSAVVSLDWTMRRGFWPSQLLTFVAGLLAAFNFLDFILAPQQYHTHTSLPAAAALVVFSLAAMAARPGWGYGASPGDPLQHASMYQRWFFQSLTLGLSNSLRYGGAVVLVIIALISGEALQAFGTTAPFVTFYPSVFLAATLGGIGPGLLATVLSGLAADYYFLPPAYSLEVPGLGDSIGLAAFLATGAGISVLAQTLDRSRKRSAENSRRSFLYARSLIEASLDPLVTISAEGKITDVNKATEEATGVPRDLLIGTDFASYFTEPEKARAGYREAFDRGYVTDHELALRHVSGKVMNVIYRASIYRDAEGAVAGVFAAARDITKRKRAETVLRNASLYTRSLIEASLDPLVTISAEGKITDVNKATEEATGLPRSEIIGTDFASYFTEPEKARAGYREAFDRGYVTDHELALRHVSGKVMDVIYRASIYRDAEGAVAGVFAAARDITKRKLAENVLRTASLYARSLIEASLDPLVTINPEGKITDVNKATEEVTGVSRGALIGTDFANYFTEPEKAHAGYRQVFKQGRVTDYALAIRHVSGKIIDVLYNASLYRDEKGEPAGVFAAARDVTERKRAEAELAAYRQHLEEMVAQRTAELQTTNNRLEGANSELETFAYSVSHDLRTPLRAVDGFSRILIEDYAPKLDAEGQRIVNVIRDATKKMAQMIDDILAFSRAGRLELSIGPIDMDDLVEASLKSLEPALAGSKLKVTIQPLPAAVGDAPMIQRVWTNLLDNAIKFTRAKPQGAIEVGARAGEGETAYYVKDNGVGFDMQYASKLFGVFQRLHRQNEFPGTGIGLAIVKRIVTRHGGRVWAEGKVGEGATIYFTLPKRGTS